MTSSKSPNRCESRIYCIPVRPVRLTADRYFSLALNPRFSDLGSEEIDGSTYWAMRLLAGTRPALERH